MKPLNSTKPKTILDLLSHRDRRFLEATFARNRAVFGELRMDVSTPPAPAPPAPAPAHPGPAPTPPADPPKIDDWDASKGAGGKDAVLADLARARAEAKAAADARDALQAEKDARDTAALSDLQKAEKKAADESARADKAERAALVAKVALAKKLPAALADRLAGSTRAELEADADALLALIPAAPEGPRAPAPDPSQGGGDGSKVTGGQKGKDRWHEKHPRKSTPGT